MLKLMINDFWYLDRVSKTYENTAINEGQEEADVVLYEFYAKPTANYPEFKNYTVNEIYKAFKDLIERNL